MKKCKDCGKEIANSATACPNCGGKTSNANITLAVMGIIIAAFLLLRLLSAYYSSQVVPL